MKLFITKISKIAESEPEKRNEKPKITTSSPDKLPERSPCKTIIAVNN
jgi:hypothetical protein